MVNPAIKIRGEVIYGAVSERSTGQVKKEPEWNDRGSLVKSYQPEVKASKGFSIKNCGAGEDPLP